MKNYMSWVYSKIVQDHFFKPRNFVRGDKPSWEYNAVGQVGSPACGDVMKFWLYIDPKTEKIKKAGWQTFGCASAIGSTSVLSVMLTEKGGLKLNEALKITPQDILKRLGGLPARKIHCSVLGDKALREAINDYFKKTGQENKIMGKNQRIVDPITKTTEEDIEKAVISGAKTLAEIQAKFKIGVGNKNILPQIEELIRFYCEKHSITPGVK
jgi:NifU-like protein involved in Fe-S cluster formation